MRSGRVINSVSVLSRVSECACAERARVHRDFVVLRCVGQLALATSMEIRARERFLCGATLPSSTFSLPFFLQNSCNLLGEATRCNLNGSPSSIARNWNYSHSGRRLFRASVQSFDNFIKEHASVTRQYSRTIQLRSCIYIRIAWFRGLALLPGEREILQIKTDSRGKGEGGSDICGPRCSEFFAILG